MAERARRGLSQRINTTGLEPHTRAALVAAIGALVERLDPKGPRVAAAMTLDGAGTRNRRPHHVAQRTSWIVAVIRAMAASQMQEALRSLEAIRGYSSRFTGVVRSRNSTACHRRDRSCAATEKSALVVFCAEHGCAAAQ
jgi:hypothetical protein